MRRLLLGSFLLLAFGCSNLLAFDLTLNLAEQRVNGSPVGGLLGGFFELPIPLEVDLASETAARDTGPAQAVRLTALTLDITPTAEEAGDTDDFGFVDSIEIFVESRESGSDLPRVRVANVSAVPDGARQIAFETDTSVDLRPYINEGARLTSSAEGTVPPDDVTFDGQILLTVEVL
ncbi:MAG: hypothetical protein RLO52_09225 [Sandaracinaceae bacterium]